MTTLTDAHFQKFEQTITNSLTTSLKEAFGGSDNKDNSPLKSLFNRKDRRGGQRKNQSDSNRGRSTWARKSPCYSYARFGHTARDHGISYPYTDEVEKRYKTNQKYWLIILKHAETIEGDRVEWEDVAKEIHVDTTGWPKLPHRRGLARVLHAKAGLEPWSTLDDVGTDCSPSQCYTPYALKEPDEPSTQDNAESVKACVADLGFTLEWKNSIDSRLGRLEGNVGDLQKSQNVSVSLMEVMLQTQGVPQHIIDEKMAAASLKAPQPHTLSLPRLENLRCLLRPTSPLLLLLLIVTL